MLGNAGCVIQRARRLVHVSTFLIFGFVLGFLALAGGCSSPESRPASRFNVVLVIFDAARADHFGSYGYARDTTPIADAFAIESMRYETVISEAPFTFLSMSSLMTAGSPAVTGLVGRAGAIVPSELELVSETAQAAGFATLAYSENPFVTDDFGLAQGFEYFEEVFPVEDYRQQKDLDPTIDSGTRLAAILEKAAAEFERPFFLFAHLLRPHNPYAPPAPFAGRFGSVLEDLPKGGTEALVAMDREGAPFDASEIEKITNLYDENLSYADGLFGGLLADLEARGLRENSIVILASDHGEAFGEHGRMLHNSQLYDSMLRVPLMIDVPGEQPGSHSIPIQLADLGRGLRSYFQGKAGAATNLTRLSVGRDLDAPLYSWTNANGHLVAARTERRKLVVNALTLGVVAYHDLIADPGELEPLNLDREGDALLPGLARKIGEWVGIPIELEATPEMDPSRRSQLEALGYLEPAEKD